MLQKFPNKTFIIEKVITTTYNNVKSEDYHWEEEYSLCQSVWLRTLEQMGGYIQLYIEDKRLWTQTQIQVYRSYVGWEMKQ